ncbi:MAG: hypothetical protein VKI42_01070 [Synechococcaceae cyanobacterium]|nr:hypothetical protein [Synechococcaceae cyanobacterium]
MGLAKQGETPGRTTLLDAVNICLQTIGEQPVNSLETQQVTEAAMAESTILELHREGQTRGWSWNTEQAYRFLKDAGTGKIVVPANVVSFSTDAYEWAGRFQLRGQTVYDRQERSTVLGDDIPSLDADVVLLLPWDECPEVFNRWVTIRAARVFSGRVLSSDAIFRYTAMDEQMALVELQRVELQQAQPNSLTGGPGLRPFPTYSPGLGLLGRNGGYRRG